jgi:hypothetical protein
VFYDLTNSYFEGQCVRIPKACLEFVEVVQFGCPKETCSEQS